jgi:hypothetical protein
MTGFIATDEVSLNGSPTVSPTTVAVCSGEPFSFSSTSTIFLALSRAAGIGHEDGLVQTEQRDRDEVADEQVRLEEGERQGREEDRQEDAGLRAYCVQISTTRLLSSTEAFWTLELDVLLDELDGPMGAGRDRWIGAGEPVDQRRR